VIEWAELPATPWSASGLASLRDAGQGLGLAADWKSRVVGAAGSYAEIFARNLGARSPLGLPRGPDAPVEAGGAFVTPSHQWASCKRLAQSDKANRR